MTTDGAASQAPARRDELSASSPRRRSPSADLRATTVRDIADSAGILSRQPLSPLLVQGGDGGGGAARLSWTGCLPATRRSPPPSRTRWSGSRACSWRRSRRSSTGTRRSSSTRTRRRRLSGAGAGSPIVEARNKEQRQDVAWTCSTRASRRATSAPIIDVDLVYRFIRDTTWVSVRWYEPGGPLTAEAGRGGNTWPIVLGGIRAVTTRRRLNYDRGLHRGRDPHRRRT